MVLPRMGCGWRRRRRRACEDAREREGDGSLETCQRIVRGVILLALLILAPREMFRARGQVRWEGGGMAVSNGISLRIFQVLALVGRHVICCLVWCVIGLWGLAVPVLAQDGAAGDGDGCDSAEACLEAGFRQAEIDPERAISFFQQALVLEPGHVQTQVALAGQYLALGRLDEAQAVHEQILDTDAANGPALSGRYWVFRKQQRHDEAHAALAHAQEMTRDLGSADEVVVLVSLTLDAKSDGRERASRRHYNQAVRLAAKLEPSVPAANALQDIAYLAGGVFEQPQMEIELSMRALDFFEQVGNDRGQISTLRQIAALRSDPVVGTHWDLDAAQEFYLRALALATATGDGVALVDIHLGLAENHVLLASSTSTRKAWLQNWYTARDHGQSALALSREVGLKRGEANALVRLALSEHRIASRDVDGAAGLFASAERHTGEAIALFDGLDVLPGYSDVVWERYMDAAHERGDQGLACERAAQALAFVAKNSGLRMEGPRGSVIYGSRFGLMVSRRAERYGCGALTP